MVINIPVENYHPFLSQPLVHELEPPIEAQHYYALVDPIIQAVLSNPRAHPQSLLERAAVQFQERFLVAPDELAKRNYTEIHS